MPKNVTDNLSSEMLAAFLDGNTTAEESQTILNSLSEDAQLRELLRISQLVDSEIGSLSGEFELLPMMAMAATCEDGAFCSLECEKYILRQFNIAYDDESLMQDAVRNGWFKENGTALHNVGRHLEKRGLIVSRIYNATMKDLTNALNGHEGVIVAVDGGELLGDRAKEYDEDIFVGQNPDHTIVVISVDEESVTVYDPDSPNMEDHYPIKVFVDAWNDSKNYLLTITLSDMKEYDPRPINLTDVVLSEELNELREAIAENAHDVWAAERKAQGWKYGAQRNDTNKETPCMVPYSQLPESEKTFDREMAMNTLKLLKKLGYDIIKH